MNFEYFESLDLEGAQEYLRQFLDSEGAASEAMRCKAEGEGVVMDYSVTSVPSILKWLLRDVRIFRVPIPATEPDWIREAHKGGLIEFEEGSKNLVLRAAYYMGESFTQTYRSLRWTTGNPKYIERNMPAVAGFRCGIEMAPIMIAENVFADIVGREGLVTQIDAAVVARRRHVEDQ